MKIYNYNTNKINFKKNFQQIFEIENLELIHKKYTNDNNKELFNKFNDNQTYIHKLFFEKINGDKIIWSIVLLLAIFSFLPVYSAISNFGNSFILSNLIKHVAIVLIGIFIMWVLEKKFIGISKSN